MSTHVKSIDQLAWALEAQTKRQRDQQDVEWREQRSRHQQLQAGFQELTDVNPASALNEAPRPVLAMDSTLGIRTRPAERGELQEFESALRLDMGFACRGDFAGK